MTKEGVLTPPPAGHNMPPMNETAKADITEQLAPKFTRLAELDESLARRVAAGCKDDDEAGKCVDLAKLYKKLWTATDNIRKDVKEPYAEAVAVIDAAPKPILQGATAAQAQLKGLLLAYDKMKRDEEDKKRREEAAQQKLEDERLAAIADREREAAAAANIIIPEQVPPPPPPPEPARKAASAPIASGDYGGSAGRTVRKVPVIVDVYALPEVVLNAPRVTEAILTVVRAMRSANPDAEIPGIEIQDEHGISLR